jgi:hypothetical protein
MTGCMRSGNVTLPTHATGQQTTMFSSNCWLKQIPKDINLPFAVHAHEVIVGYFVFRIVYNFPGFRLNVFPSM